MKIKREIKDELDGLKKPQRYILWTCDKCNENGFTWVRDFKAEDLPEDQKKHCD